jgi:hypothetical protein
MLNIDPARLDLAREFRDRQEQHAKVARARIS